MEPNEPSLNRLPTSTVKLISSAQVITSVSSVVKELMENSLDAGASSIEVHLDGYGLDRVEVKDNGCGLKQKDVQFMCQRSFTSKISDFSDIDKLSSYGFRGEALFSICAVSDVTVTTVCSGDPYAKIHKIDHNGEVTETKPANLDKGTSVVAKNLFKNLPVRKQFLTSGRRKADEMRNVEQVVKSLALINCEVKVRLTHNKFTLFQKAGVCDIARSFVQVLPPSIVKQLQEIFHEDKKENLKFTLLVPKQDCNIVTTCLGHSSDAIYLFVNSRPVREKDIEKAVQSKVFEFFGSKIPSKKYPAMLASVVLPPDMIDVNIEPNKTRVLIRDVEKVTKLLRDQLSIYYYGADEETILSNACAMDPPKRKTDSNARLSSPTRKKAKPDELTTTIEEAMQLSQTNADIFSTPLSNSENNNRCVASASTSVFDPNHRSTPMGNDTKSCSPSNVQANISKFLDGMGTQTSSSLGSSDVVEVIARAIETSLPITTVDPSEPAMIETANNLTNCILLESEFFSTPLVDPFNEKEVQNGGIAADFVQNQTGESSEDSVESDLVPVDVDTLAAVAEDAEISLSCWSRGDVQFGGKQLEGTTVVRGRGEDESSPFPSSSQDRSVSSQMGQKDMSAFTKFARQMRMEIVKAQPGISFPRIAKELTKRWQELQDEDKKMYKDLAVAEKREKKCAIQSLKRTSSNDSPQSARSGGVRPSRKVAKSYPSVCTVKIDVVAIREAVNRRGVVDFDEKNPTIIADITDDLSIVKDRAEIQLLSCSRLYETVKWSNNVKNLPLELKALDKGISVYREELGPLWSVLESLDSSIDVSLQTTHPLTALVVTDERILKNGFRIEKTLCSSGNKYTITDLARDIHQFGVHDLIEILQLISNDERCRLKTCRPRQVLDLIRSQTIESIKGQQFPRTNYTIDLYKHWRTRIRANQPLCPHDRPISKSIVPQSL